MTLLVTPPVTTDADGDCCAHSVRKDLSATFPDGCWVEWDEEGFTFTHAHSDGDAVVTIEEDD